MPARVRRDPRAQLVTAIIIVLVLLASWWIEPSIPTNDTPPRAAGALADGEYEVLRIVDGDTFLLRDGRQRVRLQGLNTPETVKEDTPVEDWGPEASAYTEKFMREASNRVRITVDGEGVDQYGRHLAFVWHDGRLLNEELIAVGLAKAKLGYHYSQRMKDRLRAAENKARRERLGIWSGR